MADEVIACLACGQPFTLTDAQRAWFTARAWQSPRRCETCRARQVNHDQGRLVRWVSAKSFGFVETRNGSTIFTHAKFFRDPNDIVEGMPVLFRWKWDREGRPQAVHVRRASALETDGQRDARSWAEQNA